MNAVLEEDKTGKAVVPLVQVASRIAGMGTNLPPRVVGNDHFASYLDTSDEWIRDRTGIGERRWAEKNVTASELAEPAARKAIEHAGLTPADIDAIVFATVTPDKIFPSSACILQGRLGIKRGFAFDVNAVCSGFIYALASADSLIARGLATNVLVIGCDLFSKIIDPQDRTTCILFGDGAGALVLTKAVDEKSPKGGSGFVAGSSKTTPGIYGSILASDGSFGDILATPAMAGADGNYLTMAGKEVFKLAVRYLGEISEQVLNKVGLDPTEIDFFISHQANKRILTAMARHLGVPEEKVLSNVESYGNTSAASVPILLAEAWEQGKIKPGNLLLLNAFGGGITWGAIVARL